MKKINYSKLLPFIILILALQIPSIRAFCKVFPLHYNLIIPAFLVIVILYYYAIFNIKNIYYNRLINSFIFPAIILLTITILNYYLYPIIDGRKNIMLGSDQDDAVIAVAKALFSGNSPYHIETYLNTGASTGPGFAILLSPFILSNTYFLLTPSMIGILLFVIYKSTKNIKYINYFLLILISSPAFWEMMTNGSDLIAFGIFCILPLFLWKNEHSIPIKIIILVFLSMTLTSRIIFIYLAPLYGLFFSKKDKFLWIIYTLTISTIVSSLHFIFYMIEPEVYSPILLINKGLELLNIQIIVITILLFIIIFYQTIKTSKNLTSNLFLLWAWLAIPLLIVTLTSFDYEQNILIQYPFTYLTPQILIYLTFFIKQSHDSSLDLELSNFTS